ncbi:MAG: HDOD domain-containing protein [Campylobacterota bacterium]|nr:HDOD domain-containing protein [Campylobacterota bacterium]
MKDKILEKIKQLPPLPESAIQIESIYQDPDSSFNDMVKVLEKDPLLTADILKAANSPLYGFSREINSVARAVSLFGMGAIRGFALASIVKNSFSLNLSPYGISNDQFAALSKMQHALMSNMCMKKHRALLDVLSPAAFLVEIGKVLIAQTIIDLGKEAEFKAAIASGDIEATEIEFCTVDTAEVSATIFDHWRFDSNLVDTIKSCTNPAGASEENRLACQILQIVRTAVPVAGAITPESIEAAKALVTEYAIDEALFDEAIATVMA